MGIALRDPDSPVVACNLCQLSRNNQQQPQARLQSFVPNNEPPKLQRLLGGADGATLLRLRISKAFSLSTLATVSSHLLFHTFLPDALHEIAVPYSFALLRDRLNLVNEVLLPL